MLQIDLHSMEGHEEFRKHSRPQDWELTILSKLTKVIATVADAVHQRLDSAMLQAIPSG